MVALRGHSPNPLNPLHLGDTTMEQCYQFAVWITCEDTDSADDIEARIQRALTEHDLPAEVQLIDPQLPV